MHPFSGARLGSGICAVLLFWSNCQTEAAGWMRAGSHPSSTPPASPSCPLLSSEGWRPKSVIQAELDLLCPTSSDLGPGPNLVNVEQCAWNPGRNLTMP